MNKNEILIRVINSTNQKIKMVFPSIANNKQLMKNVGFVISDPNYDIKMECFRNKKPYIQENGQTKESVKENSAPVLPIPVSVPVPIPVEIETNQKIEQPENILKKKRGRPKKITIS